jgi:AcrR family transcriptional regulator
VTAAPRRVVDLREVVLDCALRRFSAQGYSGTTMRDIARDVDCSTSTIYQHFASKYHILVTIIDDVMTELEAAVTTALDEGARDPAPQQLHQAVRAHILVHTAKLQRESLIAASEMRSLDGPELITYIERRDRYEAIFREIVRRGIKSGAFACGHPKEAVRAILVMSTGVASWYQPRGQITPTQLADIYAELALEMLGNTGK